MTDNTAPMIPRPGVLESIRRGLSRAPSVALLGARQVGKSTLARQVAAEWTGPTRIFDLESQASRDALGDEPETVLREAEGLVVIDEVQRMPHLFELLRPVLDNPDRQAVFLLLGSAVPATVKGVSESLAGRIRYVDVGGFTVDEVGPENLRRLWWRGGLPEAYLAPDDIEWADWMLAFTRSYIESDLPTLGTQVPAATLHRFWAMSAHLHGQTWNAAMIGKSMDVARPTANRYRDLFASTYMLRVLQPWFVNIGKRLVKSPKVYFRDSGVLHYLLGLHEMDDLYKHPQYGFSWEGFAIEQTLRVVGERGAHFYGATSGAEIDLVIERGPGRMWGFEFKCTETPGQTKSMATVSDDLGLEHLWVVYPGDFEYLIEEGVTALPLSKVGGLDLRRRG